MKESAYKVMIGPPGPNFSWGTVKGLFALTTSKHEVKFINSGNGFDDFDAVWTDALNASEEGKITHFAMLHLDVHPIVGDEEPLWLDVLIEELDRLDLDLVSTVIPLKDFTGVTSSGIGDPGDPWSPLRRLTMREVAGLPPTFDAAMLGYAGLPLLHNTGCWACDLRKPVFHREDADGTCGAYFAFPERVHRSKITGKWEHSRESEDWFFSRCLHRLGAKTAITSKVRLTHLGKAGFRNYGPWGTQEHDEGTAGKWNVPRGPWDQIQGWFDFADIYQNRIDAAADGAHFVEVGSWLGKSTVFMASKIRQSGKAIKFDCVDNWQGGSDKENGWAGKTSIERMNRDLFAEFMGNLARCEVTDVVTPIRSDSSEAAGRYADGSLDFVFIDADHSEAAVACDLRAWWPKIKPGGWLAGHDYHEVGPQAAADAFAEAVGRPLRKECRSYVIEAAV